MHRYNMVVTSPSVTDHETTQFDNSPPSTLSLPSTIPRLRVLLFRFDVDTLSGRLSWQLLNSPINRDPMYLASKNNPKSTFLFFFNA